MILSPVGFLIPGKTYFMDGAEFSSEDRMTKGSALTGASNGKQGIFSAWIKPPTSLTHPGSQGFMLKASNIVEIYWRSASSGTYDITITIRNAASAVKVNIGTASAIATGSWVHVLSSWNTGTNAKFLYINDSANLSVSTFEDDTLNYEHTSWEVGDQSAVAFGTAADIYFNTATSLDLSVAANRWKFRDEYGRPVSLGSDGSTPTGSAPSILFHLDDGQAASNFATNRGAGGNFTVSAGTLATSATSPSDG